jgi:hypothetical protein
MSAVAKKRAVKKKLQKDRTITLKCPEQLYQELQRGAEDHNYQKLEWACLDAIERMVDTFRPIEVQSPNYIIAEDWYSDLYVLRLIRRSGEFPYPEKIPDDINSYEFSDWLAKQLREAMVEGIEIGRQSVLPATVREEIQKRLHSKWRTMLGESGD